MALAQIERATAILQQNANAAKVQRPYHKGLCWCPEMEKEAELQLNPNTDIRLKAPVLVAKRQKWEKEELAFILNEEKHINKWEPLSDSAHVQYNNLRNKYVQLVHYDLDDEYQHFRRMQELMEKRGDIINTKRARGFQSWLSNRYVLATTPIKEIPCTCRGGDEISLQQILPVGSNTPEVICYNACDRTLYAAFKRQMMRVYEPDPCVASKFQQYTRKYFDTYVEPVLRSFDYSYSQWFNKMPRNKQQAMKIAEADLVSNGYPDKVEYGLFCKREKQEAGGKNRAIANIEPMIKYIMGPVCWSLEDVADKYFPGYCGKKSWDDLEHLFEEYYAEGFHYVLQGDGSAFDTCQHYELKEIDRLIYSYLADNGKIWHVEPQHFKRLACAELRELNAKTFTATGARVLGSATIRGTVFSGASDTTLMNTLRMALYNMFTLESAGLVWNKDFKLLAKGDDFIIFSRVPAWKGIDFQSLYLQTWKPKPKHSDANFLENKGCLGMILKFLNVGDYDTIDFCSVTCIPYDDHTKFKLARKPDRMVPLAHYARKTLRMTNAQIKQYLIDQAYALEVSHGNMPFYRDYAVAYRNAARKIKAKAARYKTGRARLSLPDDGHKKVAIGEREEFIDQEFYDYGHEYQIGLLTRFSTHTDGPTQQEVEDHLLRHFGISANDITYHAHHLIHGGLYDAIADK